MTFARKTIDPFHDKKYSLRRGRRVIVDDRSWQMYCKVWETKKRRKNDSYSMRPCSSFREATAKEQRCNRILTSPEDPPKDQKKLFGDVVDCPCCALQCQLVCSPSCHTCARGRAIFSSARLLDKVLVNVTHASATKKKWARHADKCIASAAY
jgi:hypothetical protein